MICLVTENTELGHGDHGELRAASTRSSTSIVCSVSGLCHTIPGNLPIWAGFRSVLNLLNRSQRSGFGYTSINFHSDRSFGSAFLGRFVPFVGFCKILNRTSVAAGAARGSL